MTHEELLAELNEDIKAATSWGNNAWLINAKALRAVVELHKPYKNYRNDECFCEHCGEAVDYPCPTIQAIEAELK